MGNRLQQIHYNFSGGLNSADPKRCLPNQLQEAVNVMVDKGGVIRQRYAFSSAVGAGSQGLSVDGSFPIDNWGTWSAWSDKTVRISPNLVTYPDSVGGPGQYLGLDNGTLRSNGRDPMRWVGGAENGNVVGAPKSRILHYHNDRVFAATGWTLYETVPGVTPTTLVDAWSDGASWSLPALVYGLGSIGRNLFIFMNDRIHIQVGYTKSERQTYPFSTDHGCRAPDTIKEVMVAGIGKCLIFLSTAKKLCLLTMDGIVEIGQAVDNHLMEIATSNTLDPMCDSLYVNKSGSEGFVTVLRAKGVYHKDGFYVLGYADTEDVTYNAFDKALCVSLNFPYDSQYGRSYPITLWENTGKANTINCSFIAMNDESIFGLEMPTIMARTNTKEPYKYDVLFMGGKDTKAIGSPDITIAFHADSVSSINDVIAGTDVYSYIPIKIKTRDEDAGNKQILKQWVEMIIRAIQKYPKMPGSAFFPLTITQEVDYDLNYDSPPFIEEEKITGGNRPRGYEVELKHDLVSDGVQTNITIENYSSLDKPMIEINSISIFFLPSNSV